MTLFSNDKTRNLIALLAIVTTISIAILAGGANFLIDFGAMADAQDSHSEKIIKLEQCDNDHERRLDQASENNRVQTAILTDLKKQQEENNRVLRDIYYKLGGGS